MASCQKLPIFHIYIPVTLKKVVDNFFNSNQTESDCFLIGQYDWKSDKFGTKVSSKDEGVITRSKSASTFKLRNSIDNFPPASSKSGNGKVRPGGTSLDFDVLAVSVLGIAGNSFQHIGDDVQIIGRVMSSFVGEREVTAPSMEMEGSCPLLFQFQYSQDKLSIPFVSWGGVHLEIPSSTAKQTQLILFEYDPVEFQSWKMPNTHPLGLPAVFLKGLKTIQNQQEAAVSANFIPAFTPISQDHQDLNACFKVPEDSYMFSNPMLKFCCQRSAGIQQITHKVCIMTETLMGAYPILPVVNFFFLLLLDSIIGYLITSYLVQIPDMLGLLHVTVEEMLVKLNHLLKWLRGAPAGLKLNINLNSLYWRFFSYHIHLWASYIGILEPIFSIIIHTIQYFGVLGATVQITLLKDLLSLATFHVYCLYIYASRLYALQISAIKALCRVFFGRKYNPLRNRIDSVQLTTPELFLSSFGFVILIFLFPTTVVYYTGFLCLRVPALFIERTLQYLVTTYNQLPFISWLLVFLKSPRVADEVYLVPKNCCTKSSTITFRLCLQSTRTLFAPPDFGGGFRNILSSCLSGTVLKE